MKEVYLSANNKMLVHPRTIKLDYDHTSDHKQLRSELGPLWIGPAHRQKGRLLAHNIALLSADEIEKQGQPATDIPSRRDFELLNEHTETAFEANGPIFLALMT